MNLIIVFLKICFENDYKYKEAFINDVIKTRRFHGPLPLSVTQKFMYRK